MKKTVTMLCMIMAILVVMAALRLQPDLPGDARTYIEKKYAGWSGVLHAWVYEGDGCASGSLAGWLNKCAATFEKTHTGVYIEYEYVTADRILFLNSATRRPDLIFFPPGLLSLPSGLAALSTDGLRAELAGLGGGYALPVAMGGYIWAVSGDADAAAACLPEDTASSKYSAAAICMLAQRQETDDSGPEILSEYELDLGLDLAAMNTATEEANAGIQIDENAYGKFRDGDAGRLLVSQREIGKLVQLRDAGKGASWTLEPAGDYVYSDQFLYGAIIANDADDGEARTALAEAFLRLMLTDDLQKALANYGACPVTEIWAYAANSAYAPLEVQLRRGKLIAPKCFSEYWNLDFAANVRNFASGGLTADEALRRLMLSGLAVEM